MHKQKAPKHNTIAKFRSKRLRNFIDSLFNQLIAKLGELQEINYKSIFIDGIKIEIELIKEISLKLKFLKEKIILNLSMLKAKEKVSCKDIWNYYMNGHLKPAYNIQIGVNLNTFFR